MNELFSVEITQTLENAVLIGLGIICILLFIPFLYFAIKCDKLEKWTKLQDSLYAKAIVKIAELQDLLSNLTIRCLNQSIHIELLKDELKIAERSTKRKSLRTEIARLTGLNNGLAMTINHMDSQKLKLVAEFNKKEAEYKDRIQRLTETIDKRKHKPKQSGVDSEIGWWKSITDKYSIFPRDEVFHVGINKALMPGFMILFDNPPSDLKRAEYLVDKRDFKPVKS